MPKKIGFDLHSSVEDDARTRFPHLNKREESGGDGKRLLGITWKWKYHFTTTAHVCSTYYSCSWADGNDYMQFLPPDQRLLAGC